MAGTKDIGLADLFSESNMKMQSSTIYKALRGDGMRVRPLARSKNGAGKTYSFREHSGSRPGSYKLEKGRVAEIKNMFESKTTSSANDSTRKASNDAPVNKSHNQYSGLNQPDKTLCTIRRRELTPLSESSTQRVPFRSTQLERPVSRASLKEDDLGKKPKTLKRTIDTRALQKKSVPLFEVLPKGRCKSVEEKCKIPANTVQTRLGSKKRVLTIRRLGMARRATVVAGKPVIIRNNPPVITRKEESKKTEAGAKDQQISTSKMLKPLLKPELKASSSIEIPRVHSMSKTPAWKKTARNAIVREVVQKTRIMSPVQPIRKQLWLPTETRESFNQFCPDTKAKKTPLRRKRRPQRLLKKKPNKDVLEDQEQKGGTANTLTRSKFDNTTDDEASETDEEEARMVEQMRKRNELMRISQDFFNQFKHGEILRKSMPEVRYTSEILAKSEAEVKRRMTEMEVRMRLSRLDESVAKIDEFVPKWTSMLLATKDVGKAEKIQKTLTNSDKIMTGKVDKARMMLEKYLSLTKNDGHSPRTEEMENIETLSELVQFEMDSLGRIFESYERQLQEELDEPTSISL